MQSQSASRTDLARGAWSVMLARIGALVDVLATPAYAWMFGISAFGAYAALWAAVSFAQTMLEFGLTAAIQRCLPGRPEDVSRRMVGASLLIALGPTFALALLATLSASWIAELLRIDHSVVARPQLAISIFAWALPLYALLEVSTALLRSRRTFGAEIRLRIMWEQMLRLVFSFLLWMTGAGLEGLLLAHLLSLAVAGVASLRLVLRGGTPAMPMSKDIKRLLGAGIPVVPLSLAWRVFIDLPPLLIPIIQPGSAGLAGAGLYAIARKLSSSLALVKQIFSYVLAPIAASERQDLQAMRDLHGFSARCSTFMTLPFWMAMIVAGPTLLDAYADGGRAAYTILAVLATGRLFEVLLGPSGTIQQVSAHPMLAILNASIGISSFLIVLIAFPPTAVGAAMAAAAGQVAVSLASALHVRGSIGVPLAPGMRFEMLPGHGAALGCVVAASLLSMGVTPWLGAIIVVASAFVGAWISARMAMPLEDRMALGRLGRKLRLNA